MTCQRLNDLIWRAMSKADIPAVKDCQNYCKMREGLALIPWHQGKQLIFDVIDINAVADFIYLRVR